MAPLERAMVVSYGLSIVTVALSVTIRPQFAIECLRRTSNRGGGWPGEFGPKFPGVPLRVNPLMFESAGSEHHMLTNGEIFRKISNVCGDHNPPT